MSKISHGGECAIAQLHALDDTMFQNVTGMSKETFKANHGPCDAFERRADTGEDPEEFLQRNQSTEKSYPKAIEPFIAPIKQHPRVITQSPNTLIGRENSSAGS